MSKIVLMKFCIFLFITTATNAQLPYTWVNSIHTSLGVPSDQDTTNDYIIVRPQYVTSYNSTLGIPNWVAWNLNADWFGDVERYEGNFITDTSLPIDFYRVKHSDYTNSGFDRGHVVRSEERTKTVDDNKSTFLLTNIMPQTPDLNRGVWLDFEYFLEDLCKEQNKELFIVSGGIYNTMKSLKDEGKVAIPDSCFKFVIVLEKGQTKADIDYDTKVYAVMMPNVDSVRKDDWTKYATTIRNIEDASGYYFLSDVIVFVSQILKDQVGTPVEDVINKEHLKAYPNPTSEFIFVELPDGIISPEVEIHDMLGRKCNVEKEITLNKLRLNTGELETGMYFLIIKTGTNNTVIRFIVVH